MSRLAGLYHPGGAVRIGDDLIFVRPLRLKDLAALNAWLETRIPHPYEAIRTTVADLPPGDEQDRYLAKALEQAASWGPTIFGDGWVHLFTPEGIATFLLTVVSPALTRDRALDLALNTDLETFSAIRRYAFGYDPKSELESVWTACEPKSPRPPSETEDDGYAGLLLKLATDFGWTPAEVGELTLAQLKAICPDGTNSPISESVRLSRLERYEKGIGVTIDG